MQETFKYDIAFSFLQQDEPLAIRLNNLLMDRFNTFVYSNEQRQLAGRDGHEAFSEVFGLQSRIVVILYRKEWGETPWTRIEQTAIRNRGHDEGFQFVVMIPMEQPAEVPAWFPRTSLYVGMSRYGEKGAVAVIDQRASEMGALARFESAEDRLARAERENRYREERERFFNTREAVAKSDLEFNVLIDRLNQLVQSAAESAPSLGLSCKRQGLSMVVTGTPPAMLVSWDRYANTLNESSLELSLWRGGHPPWPGMMSIRYPVQIKKLTFTFEKLISGSYGWLGKGSDAEFHSSVNLADYVLRLMLDAADNKTTKSSVKIVPLTGI